MSTSPIPPPTAPTPRTFGPIPPTSRSSSPPSTHPPTPLSALRTRSSSGAAATASTWFNALSDGLSWIEVQGGSVAQAAESRLGDTIRGGLGRNPLSFSSFGNGAAPAMSQSSSHDGGLSGSAVDLAASPPNTTSGGDGSLFTSQRSLSSSTPNVNGEGGVRAPRVRPSSFLGIQKPTPPVPGSSNGDVQTSRSTGNMGPPAPSNLARLGPGTTPNTASIPSRTSSLAPESAIPAVTGKRTHRPSLSQPHHQAHSTTSLPGTTDSSIPRSSSSSATMGGLHHQPSTSSMREDRTTSTTTIRNSIAAANGSALAATSGGATGPGAARSSSYAAQAGPSKASPTNIRSRTEYGTSSSNNLVVQSQSRSISRSPSNASAAAHSVASGSPERSRGQMPYKAGYQPPGVRRSRMEAYEKARGEVEEIRGREEGRLGRRWGKLLDLHFNPNPPPQPTPTPPSGGLTRSTSFNDKRRSLLSMTMPGEGIKPKDLWRGLRSVSGVGVDQVAEEKKREAEMGIVKWEDDGEVRRCRICQSVFSLTNRKHHCRLCGRIVCSLPPTSQSVLNLAVTAVGATAPPGIPTSTSSSSFNTTADDSVSAHYNPRTGLPMGIRREKCSILLVADWKTGRGEVVEEGFVGWMKVEKRSGVAGGGEGGSATTSGQPIPRKKRLSEVGSVQPGSSADGEVKSKKGSKDVEEVQVKGVRCCKECWAVVSRKQKMADRRRISGFTRVYDALKEVETEIMDLLPEFQDMLLNLSSVPPTLLPSPPIPSDLVAMHKHILVLFTQYDALAKKIRSYPLTAMKGVPGTPGAEIDVSAQKRVQEAIARSAAAFVTKEAGILQALPKLQKQRNSRAASSINSGDTTPFAFSETSNDVVGTRATSKLASELDDELALKLQPLLEQEAMLEEYIKDANAQRKFDDAQTLKASLDDIKVEIARVAAGGT